MTKYRSLGLCVEYNKPAGFKNYIRHAGLKFFTTYCNIKIVAYSSLITNFNSSLILAQGRTQRY